MKKARPALLAVGAAVILGALFVALRDDDSGQPPAAQSPTTGQAPTTPAGSATTEPEPATTTTEPPPATTTAAPPAGPAATRIFVEGGRPVGGIERITAKRGDRVAIVVRSDVPEIVHLHGYDIERPVGPGKPAQLRFVAEITGRFEIELEESGVEIGDLSVTP